jgi:magnesium chelatase subunit D
VSLAEQAGSAAALLAVDPFGLGGICLRSPAQPARDGWLKVLRESLPEGTPWRRLPSNIAPDRLLGDLDIAATLEAARPVAERGALASADGGLVIITMAERLSARTASLLNGVLDSGQVRVPRSGVMIEHPARIGIVALDESEAGEDSIPPALLDRLAMVLDLHDIDPRNDVGSIHGRESIAAARRVLPLVRADRDLMETLCATCAALGVNSPRVAWLALRAALASAALHARTNVAADDAALAAQLVIAPRATQLPSEATPRDEPAAQTPEDPSRAGEDTDDAGADRSQSDAVDARVLAAARAAIPQGLLVRLEGAHADRSRSHAAGRAGALRAAGKRGRPAGSRAATGRGRLHLVETLRAAAPWQKLRGGRPGERVRIASQDLREQRFKVRSPTLTIFAVDASGSSALNRLAEAKGAVELMLAECYIRRDNVAVVAFRNTSADLVLPPTRSLVRAKRCLAGLPGGGGTPLAAALASVAALVRQARRRGETPTIVMLTDGRANIARSGAPGRAAAHADALAAARALPLCDALFIDSSPKPNPLAHEIAAAMHARYVALPHPGAAHLSGVVRAAAQSGAGLRVAPE